MNSPPPGPPDWQRISAALDQGLDLSPAEREAWLTELDHSDPLLASRLRELFIQHARLEDSGDLDAILAVALNKKPTERYATADALREDLVRYLN